MAELNQENQNQAGQATNGAAPTENQTVAAEGQVNPDRTREARRAEIVGRLSAGNLPAPERTDLEKELEDLDKDLRDNPSRTV